MSIGKWMISGLLIISVVLSCEASEIIEVQLDTWVEVNLHQTHNSSEASCEAPGQPGNGGYVSESDVIRERYNTGDTITYHCNTGHQLIGHVNRTCNGTSKQWEPHEPYCQPEYIGHLMRRLNGIEDQLRRLDGIEAELRVIKQSITCSENNTLQTGYNTSVKDSRMSTIDPKMYNRSSAVENNVSAIYNISVMESLKWQIERDRLVACTNITKTIDEDTITKCKTMQMGVRNGHSASVYTWVIEDYKSKVAHQRLAHHSQPFYHTVPGYKFRLRVNIHSDSDIYIYLQLLPGEHDDQLKWPFSIKYETTVLTNDGQQVLHRSFSGEPSTCQMNRPTSPSYFDCFTDDPNWDAVWKNKKHILANDSVVAKVYLYN